MIRGKSAFILPLVVLGIALPHPLLHAAAHESHPQDGHQHGAKAPAAVETGEQPVFPPMPAPGKKVPIGSDGYLIYGFDKKPKMGIAILKVSIFGPDGKKNTSMEVLADSGMPSMRGAHETGDQPCKLSKKGDYLVPVNIVMPGDWEVRLTVRKEGRVIFRGSHRFDV
ncbi:MAG: hypothetical protein AB1346_02965 [Thermodesulfobacteriota bacterium]